MASAFIECIEMLSCKNFYKYVLNDCHCHSQCSECCEFDIETDEVKDSPQQDHTKIDVGGFHFERDTSPSQETENNQ